MEDNVRPHRIRRAAKASAKFSALAVALLIFILLLAFTIGILVDHFFLAPTHI